MAAFSLLHLSCDNRNYSPMSNAAKKVIEICGGPQAVAEMVGVHVSRVYRWTYDRSRGGTGGRIPAARQQQLLREARRRRIHLRPEHFFDLDDLIDPSSPSSPDCRTGTDLSSPTRPCDEVPEGAPAARDRGLGHGAAAGVSVPAVSGHAAQLKRGG